MKQSTNAFLSECFGCTSVYVSFCVFWFVFAQKVNICLGGILIRIQLKLLSLVKT